MNKKNLYLEMCRILIKENLRLRRTLADAQEEARHMQRDAELWRTFCHQMAKRAAPGRFDDHDF